MSRSRWRWPPPRRSVGVIPKEAAESHRAAGARRRHRPRQAQGRDRLVGYPIVGLVHQLAKQCGEAGRYIHWGATTQDIMDTATVLQVRDALALVEADLAALDAALAALAAQAPRHGDGRAHASAARAAGDLRLQGRRLARHDRAAPPAPRRAQAARAGRPVRRRGRHAGLARRQGPRRARRADGRAGPRPPADRPGTSPATAWPRPCRSSGSSRARSPRSPPT